jgi:hypothetical protein
MITRAALLISLAALAAALVACGSGSSAVGTTAATPSAATAAPPSTVAPVPVLVKSTGPSPATNEVASSTADETRYRSAIAPQLLGNSKGIDDAFQQLIHQTPPQMGPALAAAIRTVALDPSNQLLDDARGYTPVGEPLTSIHETFLASVNEKIRRYTALVEGVMTGNRNELTVADAAAHQEDADLKNWANRVVALP